MTRKFISQYKPQKRNIMIAYTKRQINLPNPASEIVSHIHDMVIALTTNKKFCCKNMLQSGKKMQNRLAKWLSFATVV